MKLVKKNVLWLAIVDRPPFSQYIEVPQYPRVLVLSPNGILTPAKNTTTTTHTPPNNNVD